MNPAAPEPRENQGKPEPRVDARLKVTGEARYAADIPVSNLAYAVLVTSDIAAGEVMSISLEAARRRLRRARHHQLWRRAGAQTAADSRTPATPLWARCTQRKIWHDGQIMALVVAETLSRRRRRRRAPGDSGVLRQNAHRRLSIRPGTEELQPPARWRCSKRIPGSAISTRHSRPPRCKIEARIRDADPDAQPHRVVLDDGRMERRGPDDLRAHAVGIRLPGRNRPSAWHGCAPRSGSSAPTSAVRFGSKGP